MVDLEAPHWFLPKDSEEARLPLYLPPGNASFR